MKLEHGNKKISWRILCYYILATCRKYVRIKWGFLSNKNYITRYLSFDASVISSKNYERPGKKTCYILAEIEIPTLDIEALVHAVRISISAGVIYCFKFIWILEHYRTLQYIFALFWHHPRIKNFLKWRFNWNFFPRWKIKASSFLILF